jgi:hypothetical protein
VRQTGHGQNEQPAVKLTWYDGGLLPLHDDSVSMQIGWKPLKQQFSPGGPVQFSTGI